MKGRKPRFNQLQIEEIKKEYYETDSTTLLDLAKKYNASVTTISKIVKDTYKPSATA